MKIAPSLLALAAVSLFGVACKGNKTAKNDPYGAQPYGGQDPYASSGEYDNVYASGGGERYESASTYPDNSYSYGSDEYYSGGADPYRSSGGSSSSGSSSYGGGASAGSSSHTVQKGDTLFNISRRYGTTVDALRRANGINGDLIRIGERLVIP